MNQTNHFFDLGYGWLCKHCSIADAEARSAPHQNRGLFGHGEPREKDRPIGPPLASWTDSSRHSLFCPRCGIHETINKG